MGKQPEFSTEGIIPTVVATVSMSIIAPDIQLTDTMNEWQNRPAKILLIRSWKLPTKWGMSKTCINMAETLGFIIGPQGTSIGRRSPRVSRIPYKSGQLFSLFLKKNPRKCNKIQEHFLNVGRIPYKSG